MILKNVKKLLAYITTIYWLLVLMIFLSAGDQFRYTGISTDGLHATTVVGEIIDGMEVRQKISIPADNLTSLELFFATYNRQNTGTMHVSLMNSEGQELSAWQLDVSAIADNSYVRLPFTEPLTGMRGQNAEILLTTEGAMLGNAVTVYYGTSISTGRFEIVQDLDADSLYRINGMSGNGQLCIKMQGTNNLSFYKYYWIIAIIMFLVAAAYSIRSYHGMLHGRYTMFAAFVTIATKYRFLIKQLVTRDFKIKYKRSALGVAWSFFNPLLTMIVQYIVFSTLFRSNIEKFPLYLMIGIVFFSFFTEASTLGMFSITGNAPLIKKVYIPKYIYPISRVLSSFVNMGCSLIPLTLVMLVSGVPLKASMLLLVYDLICLIVFATGMALILSTSMVFFQDTQHLWSVISMMWNYLTPIFYPETIIPEKWIILYRMNPMYQYITFARTCIIDGMSPQPLSYLWCALSSVSVLMLGIYIFRKKQDEFVLYL